MSTNLGPKDWKYHFNGRDKAAREGRHLPTLEELYCRIPLLWILAVSVGVLPQMTWCPCRSLFEIDIEFWLSQRMPTLMRLYLIYWTRSRPRRGWDKRWISPIISDEMGTISAAWSGGSLRSLRRLLDDILSARDQWARRH